MTDDRPSVEFPGPFSWHYVVVDGWDVPLLTATPMPGGKISVTLDRRYDLDLTLSEAERFIPFLADAISVALGFSCHPRLDWESPNPLPHHLHPRKMTKLDWSADAES